ncbi:phosphoglycerate kinase [Snodgrassella sp. CS2]|uniref:phosphoglycerate kinase n=1 Tax=Snodgrassella sp. CS2 TaxID=3418953 RepID=UPI0029E52063|nr:phosphoglycerate kinase [Snodgrassella alvi]
MGLDMYAYALKHQGTGELKVDIPIPEDAKKIASWWKFNHLHGFFEDLYYEKGGFQEFNCKTVQVELADLDCLEEKLKNNQLEPRKGFFWGDDKLEIQDVEETYRFIEKARQFLAQGYVILYYSWW